MGRRVDLGVSPLQGITYSGSTNPLKLLYFPAPNKKRARRATLIIGILLPAITIGLMPATPYFSKKYIDVNSLKLRAAHCKVVDVDLKDATVTISPGKDFHLDYKVNAFGFPNSKIRGLWTLGDTSRYILQHWAGSPK